MPRFTLTAWLRSLLAYRPAEEGARGLFGQVLPAEQALVVLVALSLLFAGCSNLDLFAPRVRSRSVREPARMRPLAADSSARS